MDRTHLFMCGDYYADDTKVRLGDLLRQPGDRLSYLYDFGDRFRHWIELEQIVPAEESTGKVDILAGAGSCPAENSGRQCMQELLAKNARDGDLAARNKLVQLRHDAARELNYSEDALARRAFHDFPLGFDLPTPRARIQAALAAKASVRQGARVFQTFFNNAGPAAAGPAPKDTAFTHKPTGTGSYLTELVSTRQRDPRAIATCAACGSPHNLKTLVVERETSRSMFFCLTTPALLV